MSTAAQSSSPGRKLLYTVAAIIVPLVVNLPGLFIEEGLHPFWSSAFLFTAVGTGCVFAVLSCSKTWTKIVGLIIYVPLSVLGLLMFDLIFVGAVYGRNL